MTDRDHFAAAALTGLLVHANDGIDEETLDTPSDIAYTAYQMADAMLRERSRAGQKIAECDSSRAVCPERDRTNHDAAPAARATADRYVRRAAADGESDRTDKAAPRPSEGTGYTPVTNPMPKEKRAEVSVTLTDAEREAIAYCAAVIDDPYYKDDAKMVATLRGLLERLA